MTNIMKKTFAMCKNTLTSVGLMVIMVLLVLQGCAATSTNQPEEPQPEPNITSKDTLTVAKELVVGDWKLDFMTVTDYENMKQKSYTESDPSNDNLMIIWSIDANGSTINDYYSLTEGRSLHTEKYSYELTWVDDISFNLSYIAFTTSNNNGEGSGFVVEQLDNRNFVLGTGIQQDISHFSTRKYHFSRM